MRKSATATALALAALVGCASLTGVDTSGMSFAPEPLVGKVVWNDLITPDIDAARHFYGELFGWTFEQSTGDSGREYVVARSGDVYVAGFVAVSPRTDGAPISRWLPYVSVEDVGSAVSRAVDAGGEIVVAPRNVSLGRAAAILDGEGAVIGLARSAIGDPDDRTTAAALGRVVWNELLSNDSAAAAGFYGAVFGYDVRTIERRGGEYTLLGKGGADRAGVLTNPSSEAQPRWLTYFGVEDAAAAAARAATLGGTVVLPATAQLREGTMAVITDPTGAMLVLQEISL